ncbi:hypothetical protein NN561_016728 [Cricetulus griseus]
MSLRAGGGEGRGGSGRRNPRGPRSSLLALAAPGRSSLTPPAQWSLPGAPGSPLVESGIAEPQSRRRLYLRRRLEALQPELRPPPAPRPEPDEAPPAPSPLALPFPAGACHRGFLLRGPHPSAPPSASQRLALDAAIFAQAASAQHQRACVAAAPAVTRPSQLTSALPPCAPPTGEHCPSLCDPFAAFRETPRARRPPLRLSGSTRAQSQRLSPESSRPSGLRGATPLGASPEATPPGAGCARGATPLSLCPARYCKSEPERPCCAAPGLQCPGASTKPLEASAHLWCSYSGSLKVLLALDTPRPTAERRG